MNQPPVQVVSAAALRVYLPHRIYRDDQVAHCCECGRTVFFRPGSPAEPRKVCLRCLVNTTLSQRGFAA